MSINVKNKLEREIQGVGGVIGGEKERGKERERIQYYYYYY